MKNLGLLGYLQDDPMKQEALRRGLLQAGLSMMASQSPTFGGALGTGGLAGMDAYQKRLRDLQMKQAFDNAVSRPEIKPAVLPTLVKGTPDVTQFWNYTPVEGKPYYNLYNLTDEQFGKEGWDAYFRSQKEFADMERGGQPPLPKPGVPATSYPLKEKPLNATPLDEAGAPAGDYYGHEYLAPFYGGDIGGKVSVTEKTKLPKKTDTKRSTDLPMLSSASGKGMPAPYISPNDAILAAQKSRPKDNNLGNEFYFKKVKGTPDRMEGGSPAEYGPEEFDTLKAARELMKTGDPELMTVGYKLYTNLAERQAASRGQDATAEMKNWQYGMNLPEPQRSEFFKQMQRSGNIPSAIQEYMFTKDMPPEEYDRYITNKRAAQILDYNDYFRRFKPGTGEVEQVGPQKGVATEKQPAFQAETERQKQEAQLQVKRQEEMPKVNAQLQSHTSKTDILERNITRAKSLASSWTTGFMGAITKQIPGTPGFDLAQTISSVKAAVGFDELQRMRQENQTGGALGQVSDIENKLLQDAIAALEQSQSKEQFISNLDYLLNVKRAADVRLQRAFEATYGQSRNKPNIKDNW